MKSRYVIIMAGGIGSRFWPLSRTEKPKQFLDILGTGETLIQQTFRRFKQVCPEENILVVTNADHKEIVIEQLGISPERVISEPFRKNTAPCIAYGTFIINAENPDAVIAVTPADHLIVKEDEFKKILNDAFMFAGSENALVTLGIKPCKPETGYGYIQRNINEEVNGYDNLYRVRAFTEKPDFETAESFIKSGDYYWNAGIFIWSSKTILKELETTLPDIYLAFNEVKSLIGTANEQNAVHKIYNQIRSISIDYGVLEKSDKVFVLGADMGWSDLGTWGSLYDQSQTYNNENVIIQGNVYPHECSGNLISITKGKVALIEGLNDYIIVDTSEALLIIRKDEEQKIKQYLEKITSDLKTKN